MTGYCLLCKACETPMFSQWLCLDCVSVSSQVAPFTFEWRSGQETRHVMSCGCSLTFTGTYAQSFKLCATHASTLQVSQYQDEK